MQRIGWQYLQILKLQILERYIRWLILPQQSYMKNYYNHKVRIRLTVEAFQRHFTKRSPDGIVILRSIVRCPNWGSHKQPHCLWQQDIISWTRETKIHTHSWSPIVIFMKARRRGMSSEIKIWCLRKISSTVPFSRNNNAKVTSQK